MGFFVRKPLLLCVFAGKDEKRVEALARGTYTLNNSGPRTILVLLADDFAPRRLANNCTIGTHAFHYPNLVGVEPEPWGYILDLRVVKAIKEDIDIIRGGTVDTLIIHQSGLTRTNLRVAGQKTGMPGLPEDMGRASLAEKTLAEGPEANK